MIDSRGEDDLPRVRQTPSIECMRGKKIWFQNEGPLKNIFLKMFLLFCFKRERMGDGIERQKHQ